MWEPHILQRLLHTTKKLSNTLLIILPPVKLCTNYHFLAFVYTLNKHYLTCFRSTADLFLRLDRAG